LAVIELGFQGEGGGFREAGDGAKASDSIVGVLPESVAAGTVGSDLGLLSYRVRGSRLAMSSK
jgi:hypothetical protein